MKRFLNPGDRHGVLLSILMIVLGLVLVLWPGHVMATAMTLIGAALLAGGAICVASWLRGRLRGVDVLTLAAGLVMIVAGVVVLAAPKLVISLVPVIAGLVVVVNGLVNLAQALDLKREGYARWAFSLALAVLTIVLGLMLVFNPFAAMEKLVVLIGIVAIYNGASNLWIDSRYRRL